MLNSKRTIFVGILTLILNLDLSCPTIEDLELQAAPTSSPKSPINASPGCVVRLVVMRYGQLSIKLEKLVLLQLMPSCCYRIISTDDNDHHHFFVDRIRTDAGHLAKIILRKRWSVVFTDEPHFITSDQPVILQNFEKERYGFGTPGSIISFPLSPTRVLIMDDRHEELPNQYYPLLPANLGGYNFSIWRECTRFMIAGRAFPDMLNEIVSWAEHD